MYEWWTPIWKLNGEENGLWMAAATSGGNEKPLQKGDGIDLSHHSQMVGHYTGGAYNGQNTPVTGFERFVGGEF